MIALLPVAAMIALWAWATGRLRGFRWADLAAIVAGLLAIRLMTRGEWLPALAGLGWAGGWLWFGRRAWATRLAGRAARAPRFGEAMSLAEARGVLEVSPAADAATIREAHRRLILRVHPDAGGSAELARRVNGARDVLLQALNRPGPRAS